MKHTGTVNLPLHTGKAPAWLFTRMVRLAGCITEAIVYEYGQKEFLHRLSDPFWFQAFSCALGFDWHSSGTTTTTCGALKVALASADTDIGIQVAGGKGKTSQNTLSEIESIGERFSLSSGNIEELQYASMMSAKIDNTCIQDGYQLYHHCFILTEKGDWAVVQQGMNDDYARRYHWLSGFDDFINEPHNAICCDRIGNDVLNMTAAASAESRNVSLDLIKDNPDHLVKYFKPRRQRLLSDFSGDPPGMLTLPEHHPVLDIDMTEQGMAVLRKAYELQPESYEELVSLKGMGPKKIRALALISDLIYGAKPSWKDPVKYSFTHGGKDGFPYPVDRELYDHSVRIIREAIEEAKLDKKDKYDAIKRLQEFM